MILTPEPQCQPDVAGPAGALQGLAEDRGIRKCEWLEQPTVSAASSPASLTWILSPPGPESDKWGWGKS